jgi:starch synthase
VSAALPRALRRFADIRVVIPGYSEVLSGIHDFTVLGRCSAFASLPEFEVGYGHASDGLPCYVVICAGLFERVGSPYGDDLGKDWNDNDVRFAAFSYAAAQIARGLVDATWSADLVHANDWQCALIPGYLEWSNANLPTVFTIHNLAFQGVFERSAMGRLGIPDACFHIDGVEFHDRISFMKAGLVYASHLTTVSQTYAREITTNEFGCGLQGLLRRRADNNELSGILNAIDESWDPRTCSSLSNPFGAGEWEERAHNADAIRDQFGLAVSRGPLFALVARLTHQKGVDLVLESAQTILDAGGQLVVSGRGEPVLEKALLQAQERSPQSIAVKIGFDDEEAKRIFAGSDFFLMPSRFEPCGLSFQRSSTTASPVLSWARSPRPSQRLTTSVRWIAGQFGASSSGVSPLREWRKITLTLTVVCPACRAPQSASSPSFRLKGTSNNDEFVVGSAAAA